MGPNRLPTTGRQIDARMSNIKQDRKLVHSIAGNLLARYIRLVHSSSNTRAEPTDFAARATTNSPFICAVWHGQFMMVPALNTPRLPWRVLVARHGDAEAIGTALEQFDMQLIRGAGAGGRKRDRGGAAALRGALRALDDGCSIAMTVETPPGPPRKVGMGVITLARLSGRPILPCAVATSRYVALNTWSRFVINLPFARLGLVLGDPIHVPRKAGPDELEQLRLEVEDGLNRATSRAYELAEANPARSLPPNLAPQRPPGILLKSYRALTSALRPAAPLILSRRERRNKEDPTRRNERFGIADRPRPPGFLVWVHAASVGETNAVLPLIAALKARRPALRFLLTTGTVTSAKLAADRAQDLAIHQYIPLDAPQYVRRFLEHWSPDLAILTESEVWPNLILETSAREIPTALVNGRLSAKSFRTWRRRISIAQQLFGCIDVVLAQNKAMAKRFSQLGARDVVVAGNVKMDAPPPPVDLMELKRLREAIKDRQIFVATSTHPREEDLIASVHRVLAKDIEDLLTIIIPRHPERGTDIAQAIMAEGMDVRQRSAGQSPERPCDIYLADTIGEVGTFYALARLVFIGGSLVPHGGQNPVEAVKLGCGLLTGPHWHNFRDVYRELIRAGGCVEIQDPIDLAKEAGRLLADEAALEAMVQNATQTVEQMGGALERTIATLERYLPREKDLKRAS